MITLLNEIPIGHYFCLHWTYMVQTSLPLSDEIKATIQIMLSIRCNQFSCGSLLCLLEGFKVWRQEVDLQSAWGLI